MHTQKYVSRFAQGAAEAASTSAIIGILLPLFPNWTASIVSLSETSLGLGNALGKKSADRQWDSPDSILYWLAG